MIVEPGRHAVTEGGSSGMIVEPGRHAVTEGGSSGMIAEPGRPLIARSPRERQCRSRTEGERTHPVCARAPGFVRDKDHPSCDRFPAPGDRRAPARRAVPAPRRTERPRREPTGHRPAPSAGRGAPARLPICSQHPQHRLVQPHSTVALGAGHIVPGGPKAHRPAPSAGRGRPRAYQAALTNQQRSRIGSRVRSCAAGDSKPFAVECAHAFSICTTASGNAHAVSP